MQIITTNAPQAAPAVKGVPAATGILRPNFDRQLLFVRLFAPVTERPRITPTRQRRFYAWPVNVRSG